MSSKIDTRLTQLEQHVTPPGKLPSLAEVLAYIKAQDDAAFVVSNEGAGAGDDEIDDDETDDELQDDQPGRQTISLADVLKQIDGRTKVH